ncbi:MAG TPA: carbohydrate ABC transporter permease [Roseiflexaceae bacterium]|nr:carbohydrate ABC transporter permease [Roseiflexaceae bacterium]
MQLTSVQPPQPQQRSTARALRQTPTYLALLGFSLLFMLPFAWLLLSSVKRESQIFSWPPQWIPSPFWPQNYVQMFELVPMATYLLNTLKIVGLGVTGTVLTSALVGYGFARLRAPGLNILFGICLATLMLPSQVTMIPLFLLFSKLGWVDTHLPLWVPAWFGGGAWNIFLFRQFFSTIPRELEEAAMIDGAGRLGIFWRIILPNSKAVFAVVTIFAIQGFWTDVFNPVIYLNTRENYTLALGVTTLIGAQVTYFGPLMAASVMMTVPMIALYFVAQRYIAEGLVTSGIKS